MNQDAGGKLSLRKELNNLYEAAPFLPSTRSLYIHGPSSFLLIFGGTSTSILMGYVSYSEHKQEPFLL